MMRRAGRLALAVMVGMLPCAPAHADEGFEVAARAELRAVQSDIDFDEGEDIDSSGIGARASLDTAWKAGKTTVIKVEFDLGTFDYSDAARKSLDSYGGRIEVAQQISDSIEVSVDARRVENIAVLESFSADQTSMGAQIEWREGNDRIRLGVEYREREYDTLTPAKGDGYRVDAQYNRRLGSWHWLRLDLRHEEMDSKDSPIRSFERQSARIKYSHPVARRMQLRPSIEWRQWKYDSRIAEGDPEGDLRGDHYLAPALELAWGRSTRGFYGVASGEYRLRESNDIRFDNNAIRLGLRLGYRF